MMAAGSNMTDWALSRSSIIDFSCFMFSITEEGEGESSALHLIVDLVYGRGGTGAGRPLWCPV